MRVFLKIESSLSLNKEDAPKILQEDTLEGHKFEANSFPTMDEEDEEGVLTTMDEGPKHRSQTSPMSLAGL